MTSHIKTFIKKNDQVHSICICSKESKKSSTSISTSSNDKDEGGAIENIDSQTYFATIGKPKSIGNGG